MKTEEMLLFEETSYYTVSGENRLTSDPNRQINEILSYLSQRRKFPRKYETKHTIGCLN